MKRSSTQGRYKVGIPFNRLYSFLIPRRSRLADFCDNMGSESLWTFAKHETESHIKIISLNYPDSGQNSVVVGTTLNNALASYFLLLTVTSLFMSSHIAKFVPTWTRATPWQQVAITVFVTLIPNIDVALNVQQILSLLQIDSARRTCRTTENESYIKNRWSIPHQGSITAMQFHNYN